MMLVVDTRRLQALSDKELSRKCVALSKEWIDRGRPDEDAMPMWMAMAKVALDSERARRGQQLPLF